MSKMTKTKTNILTTKDIIILIRQDKSLYGKGLDKVSNPALMNVLKNRFKIENISCDFEKVRAELGRVPTKTKTDILLYNAIVLLCEKYDKPKLAMELGTTVATINKILKGE